MLVQVQLIKGPSLLVKNFQDISSSIWDMNQDNLESISAFVFKVSFLMTDSAGLKWDLNIIFFKALQVIQTHPGLKATDKRCIHYTSQHVMNVQIQNTDIRNRYFKRVNWISIF